MASGEGAKGGVVSVLGVGHEEVGVVAGVGSCRVHEWETLGEYTRWRERSDRKVMRFGTIRGGRGMLVGRGGGRGMGELHHNDHLMQGRLEKYADAFKNGSGTKRP